MKKAWIIALMLGSLTLAARAESEQKNEYPLNTCIVSGDRLGGEMGDPVIFKYKDREIRLCCSDCVNDFKKDPDKYLKVLDDAEREKAEKTKTENAEAGKASAEDHG